MNTLTEIMAADPLSLTKDQVAIVVKEMRDSRHLFNSGGAKNLKAAKPSAAEKAGVKIDLGDLGI